MISIKTITVMGTIAALTLLSPCFVQNKAIADDLEEGNPGRRGGITGTWRVMVDPQPNSGGDPPPFFVYLTFNRDGTLIQSSSDRLEGSRIGHGIWKRTSRNEFKFVFEKFIDPNPSISFLPPVISVFKAVGAIKLLTADSYQGIGETSFCLNNEEKPCSPFGTSLTQGIRLRLPDELSLKP